MLRIILGGSSPDRYVVVGTFRTASQHAACYIYIVY